MAQQQLEQQELGTRELDRAAAAADLVRLRLELDVGEAQHLAVHAAAGAAPQQGAQPREQFVERERLHQVVVGAGVQPAHPVGHRIAGGEDEHRRTIAGRPQPPADLEAVDSRHQHVQDERVGRPRGQRVERLRAVAGQLGLVALQPQRAVDRLAHRRLVVDHEDAHGPSVPSEAESRIRGW